MLRGGVSDDDDNVVGWGDGGGLSLSSLSFSFLMEGRIDDVYMVVYMMLKTRRKKKEGKMQRRMGNSKKETKKGPSLSASFSPNSYFKLYSFVLWYAII